MKGGHIIFHGTVADLLREALGKVWIITTQGNKPEGNITVVSTLKMGSSVQYRVVGELSASAGAILAEPNLEDSYVWLMREQSIPIRASS